MSRSPIVRVGCSGYEYPHWRGVFYPPDLPRSHWFEHYAHSFDTVEINATFYGLPGPDTFNAWHRRAPAGFSYAVKMSRFGTHQKKLKDPDDWLENFLERVEILGDTLGPILVQLPPNWRPDPGRLDWFLAIAPDRHRWAVEVRDPRWLCEPVFEVLRRHDTALVIHDLIEDHPKVDTTGWTYLRFHGPRGAGRFTGSYSPQALTGAARRIHHHLDEGRDVYVYFNNDIGGHAVANALDLKRYLGLG